MLERICASTLALLAVTTAALPSAFAFGGEPGATYEDETVSTHHLFLTHALAVCAGIPASDDYDDPDDAETIALYDELVDTGSMGIYSIQASADYVPPATALAAGCPWGTGNHRVWPDDQLWTDPAFFSDRYGPYSNFFHFPYEADLIALRNWALTPSTTLQAGVQLAYGGPADTLYTAQCYRYPSPGTVDTGDVSSGTVKAFAIYLHTLGDSYSHGVCRDNWGNKSNPPRYTHTVQNDPYGCAFAEHTLEFGCPSSNQEVPFVENNVYASGAIYEELLSWAASQSYTPLVSSFGAHDDWLLRQVQRYALNAGYANASARIDFTIALAEACRDAEGVDDNVCLSDVTVSGFDGVSCSTYSPVAECQ